MPLCDECKSDAEVSRRETPRSVWKLMKGLIFSTREHGRVEDTVCDDCFRCNE